MGQAPDLSETKPHRRCEGALATAAIFSGRRSRLDSTRVTGRMVVDCRVVPPRKDGWVEVSNETDGRLPNAYTPKGGFLEVSWTHVGQASYYVICFAPSGLGCGVGRVTQRVALG